MNSEWRQGQSAAEIQAPWGIEATEPREPETWLAAQRTFDKLLADLNVNETNSMASLLLTPIIVSPEDAPLLMKELSSAGLDVTLHDHVGSPGKMLVYAYDDNRIGLHEAFGSFVWLDCHSHMSAWLLMSAWRIDVLARQTSGHYLRGEYLAAACLARSAFETAAALRYEIKNLADRWGECKTIAPIPGRPFTPFLIPLIDASHNIMYGGKWQTANNPLNAGTRVNILTVVQHLDKAVPGSLGSYEWLCNLVHPSVGTFILHHSETTSMDATRPNQRIWTIAHHERHGDSQGPIHDAIGHAMGVTLTVAQEAIDAGVRIIDDIALTTQCCQLAQFDYWRKVRRGKRNDPCPCRSGKKSKQCSHEWHWLRRADSSMIQGSTSSPSEIAPPIPG